MNQKEFTEAFSAPHPDDHPDAYNLRWSRIQLELFGVLKEALPKSPTGKPALSPGFVEKELGTWTSQEDSSFYLVKDYVARAPEDGEPDDDANPYPVRLREYTKRLRIWLAVCALLTAYRLRCKKEYSFSTDTENDTEIDELMRAFAGYHDVCDQWLAELDHEFRLSKDDLHREKTRMAFDFLRLFDEKPADRVVATTVALVNLSGISREKEKGSLAILELSLFQKGVGAVFQDPRDVLRGCYADAEFDQSMRNAYAAARGTLGIEPTTDVRWRLLRAKDSPEKDVGGPSAGSAAGSAMIELLGGSKRDPFVLPMMTINSNGHLGPVAGIPSKVEAVLQSNRSELNREFFGEIDTIVLVDQGLSAEGLTNFREAESTLLAKVSSNDLAVIAYKLTE